MLRRLRLGHGVEFSAAVTQAAVPSRPTAPLYAVACCKDDPRKARLEALPLMTGVLDDERVLVLFTETSLPNVCRLERVARCATVTLEMSADSAHAAARLLHSRALTVSAVTEDQLTAELGPGDQSTE